MIHAPQPFVKWAGGKSGLMSQLSPLFPKAFRTYFEPFIGGAAVFLHLTPDRSVLSDINPRLIDCYLAIKQDPDGLFERLVALKARHSKDHYYSVRERLNHTADLSVVEVAAMMIYINKTCFNGLYRENRRGHFNVPVGSHRDRSIFSEANIFAVAQQLRSAKIRCRPFESVLEEAEMGDFVYFDPPYAPVSRTSSFTSYSIDGFDAFDQKRLYEVFDTLW